MLSRAPLGLASLCRRMALIVRRAVVGWGAAVILLRRTLVRVGPIGMLRGPALFLLRAILLRAPTV